jgi:hypothetical protein
VARAGEGPKHGGAGGAWIGGGTAARGGRQCRQGSWTRPAPSVS